MGCQVIWNSCTLGAAYVVRIRALCCSWYQSQAHAVALATVSSYNHLDVIFSWLCSKDLPIFFADAFLVRKMLLQVCSCHGLVILVFTLGLVGAPTVYWPRMNTCLVIGEDHLEAGSNCSMSTVSRSLRPYRPTLLYPRLLSLSTAQLLVHTLHSFALCYSPVLISASSATRTTDTRRRTR